MEIPFFKQKSGDIATGQEHTQTETADLKETLMPDTGNALSPKFQKKIESLNAARDKFFGLRDKLAYAQGKFNEVKAKETEAKNEAGELKREIQDLVRHGDFSAKSKIHMLSGKQAAALSLADDYRNFAEELSLDKEDAELDAWDAAKDYFSKWRSTLSLYADLELEAALSEVDERLLRAMKLKALSMEKRLPSEHLFENASTIGRDNQFNTVFQHVKMVLNERIQSLSEAEGADENLAQVSKLDIKPFTIGQMESVAAMIKKRRELERRRREAQSA
jgi:hypothetical protein